MIYAHDITTNLPTRHTHTHTQYLKGKHSIDLRSRRYTISHNMDVVPTGQKVKSRLLHTHLGLANSNIIININMK